MSSFLKKIAEATWLTRLGRVRDATAALQRALTQQTTPTGGRPAQPARPRGVVLDGLVREVPSATAGHATMEGSVDAPVRPKAPPAAAPRVVPEPVDAEADASTSSSPGFHPGHYSSVNGTRAYKLYVPQRRAGGPRPLVVMLHGCTQDPDDFARGTRMNELAEADEIYVLYPAQAVRSNAHRCWNWFVPADQQRGHGEPELLAGMTLQVLRDLPIDPARVFVAGLSAGGAMAAILAAEYPDVYAAAGVHSGLPAGAAHDVTSAFMAMKHGSGTAPARPTPVSTSQSSAPVIVFHGDADATVAPVNGEAVVGSVLSGLAARAESDDRFEGDASTRPYRRTVWRRSERDAAPSDAERWQIEGAGHAWSGGAAAGSYTDPRGPDASREMLRFFREHPRPA